MNIRVLLMAAEENCGRASELLQDKEISLLSWLEDENEIMEEITKVNPEVVLIYLESIPTVLRLCQQIYLLRPRTTVVVLLSHKNRGTEQEILQTGVHYIFNDDIAKGIFIQNVKAIVMNESTRIMALENTGHTSNGCTVLSVYGPKSGVGKTCFGCNLAVLLAKNKKKVALLDFDFQYGDAGMFLGIETDRTIDKLLEEHEKPSAEIIRKYLQIHTSGVNYLAAPSSPEALEDISYSQTEKIISSMRPYFDYIIVDLNERIDEMALSCIDSSNYIYYMTGMDIAMLKNAKKGLLIMESVASADKIRLLVRGDSAGGIKMDDVSKVLRMPVYGNFPEERKETVEALNHGIPLVTYDSSCRFSKELRRIVRDMMKDNTKGA